MKFIKRFIGQLFPPLSCLNANRIIKKSIESNEMEVNDTLEEVDSIPIESYRQEYSATFERKNKFEDKAKTNVIGITIAITLIMGAAGLVSTIANKYQITALNWIAYLILIIAVLYLLFAGIQAIKVLFSENTMCIANIHDISEDNIEVKKRYCDYIDKNNKRNIVRNNLVYSSFICIRNAIICMMVLLILVAFPLSIKNENSSIQSNNNFSNISYESHVSIPEDVSIERINNLIIQDLHSRNSELNDTSFCFVNTQEKLLIKYKINDDDLIVLEILVFDGIQTN